MLKNKWRFVGVVIVVAIASGLVTMLLTNIMTRKNEAKNAHVQLVKVTEEDTDPAKWGINWPRQYESYKKTVQATRTRFGGHGGSEALPEQKIERDPWLKRMFLGYAFSIDYRDRRGAKGFMPEAMCRVQIVICPICAMGPQKYLTIG